MEVRKHCRGAPPKRKILYITQNILSFQVVYFSRSEASGRGSALDVETDDAGGPTSFTLLSSFILSSSVFSVP